MDYTDGYARIWEDMYKDVPEIVNYFVVVAPGLDRPNPVNFAISFVRLKDWSERERKTLEITAALAPRMAATMPGVMASPINPPSLGQSFRNPPVQFVVQGNSYEELDRVVSELMTRARAFPGLSNVDSDLKLNKPQLSVDIDREKAAAVGVQVEAIGRTLETLLGGRQVTRFKREGKQYDVIVKLEDKDRRQPTDLTSIYVRGANGQLDAARQSRHRHRDRRAEGAEPLQPAARGDHLRQRDTRATRSRRRWVSWRRRRRRC